MMRSGTWWVRSKTDPRWRGEGPSPSVGMFGVPAEAQRHVDELTKTLGAPPDDLEFGYMKD